MDALNAILVSARRSLPARVLALFLALLLAVPFGCFGLSAPEKAYAQELIIAIDPGHGGGEAGAYGHGIAEEYANWLIANACMNELNTKYEGVRAVLTHDNTKVMGREERILSAKAQGAYMVVSMHCNSAENASAHGCEVWVPNNSAYNYGAYVEGYNLGKRMMQELESLGLYNRGVRTRSQDNNYYPEPGGPCDYLGINYWARVNDMCGIIVEHAFVSNYDDCWFLCGVEPCTKLGWADAHAIADYYGLKLKPGAVPEAIGPFRPEEPTPDPDPTPDPQPEVDGPHAITDKGETVYTQIEATSKEDDPAIMGASRTTVDAMVARYSRSGHSYPSNVYTQYGAASIEDFCRI